MQPIRENKAEEPRMEIISSGPNVSWEPRTAETSIQPLHEQTHIPVGNLLARWYASTRSGRLSSGSENSCWQSRIPTGSVTPSSPATTFYSARSTFSDVRPLTNRVDQDTHRHLPPAPESPGKPHVKRHGNGGKPSTTSRGPAINITHTTNTPNTVTKHIVSSLSVRDQSHTVSPKEISNCSNNLSKRDAINSSHVGPPLQTSSAGLSPPDAEIESASTTSTRRTSITSSRTTSTTATSDTGQSKVLVQSRQMTSSDMFKCLVLHGCNDLTPLINLEKYSSCRIAEGGFGDIWKGQLNDETPVAVKVLRCGLITCTNDEKKGLKRMMREIYAWSKLDHENVHKLLGVTMYQGRLGMVSKWMVRGNLRDYLGQNQGMDRYNLCVQVATGVEYIHSIDMVHGDLKAANMLLSGDGIVKLTDFDYSCLSDFSLLFTETTRVGGGTVRWMAPELVVEICNPRSKEADIYALAMTFLASIQVHSHT